MPKPHAQDRSATALADTQRTYPSRPVRLLEFSGRTLRALDRSTDRLQLVQANLNKEGFVTASAASVEWDKPAYQPT